jgi:hypothetical protein
MKPTRDELIEAGAALQKSHKRMVFADPGLPRKLVALLNAHVAIESFGEVDSQDGAYAHRMCIGAQLAAEKAGLA